MIVFSLSPREQQKRTLLDRILRTIMLMSLHSLTKTRWRHGLSIMLGCSVSSLSGQVINSLSLSNCRPNFRGVHDPDPKGTQARWNATRPLAHLAWWLKWWKLLDMKELSWQGNWRMLLTAAVRSQHVGKRVSFWTSLTHWGRDKMAAIFQTFSNAFSWMKMFEFGL